MTEKVYWQMMTWLLEKSQIQYNNRNNDSLAKEIPRQNRGITCLNSPSQNYH